MGDDRVDLPGGQLGKAPTRRLRSWPADSRTAPPRATQQKLALKLVLQMRNVLGHRGGGVAERLGGGRSQTSGAAQDRP